MKKIRGNMLLFCVFAALVSVAAGLKISFAKEKETPLAKVYWLAGSARVEQGGSKVTLGVNNDEIIINIGDRLVLDPKSKVIIYYNYMSLQCKVSSKAKEFAWVFGNKSDTTQGCMIEAENKYMDLTQHPNDTDKGFSAGVRTIETPFQETPLSEEIAGSIVLFGPDNTSILASDELFFTWSGLPGEEYGFRISDDEKHDIFSKKTAFQWIPVKTGEIKDFTYGKEYFWEVASSSDPGRRSKRGSFKMLAPEETENIKQGIPPRENLNSDVTYDLADWEILTGIYFEKNELFGDAEQCYLRAIRMDPDRIGVLNLLLNLWKRERK